MDDGAELLDVLHRHVPILSLTHSLTHSLSRSLSPHPPLSGCGRGVCPMGTGYEVPVRVIEYRLRSTVAGIMDDGAKLLDMLHNVPYLRAKAIIWP